MNYANLRLIKESTEISKKIEEIKHKETYTHTKTHTCTKQTHDTHTLIITHNY